MVCTLQDLLELPVLESAKLCSAADQLANRPVEWISVIEIPVENFVRKNELVLSTAIGCGHRVDLFQQFVEDIMFSGAAALMIAKGRYVDEVPREVIQFADRHNFPLFELPWEVRFSDVIHAVTRKINHWQHHILEQSEEMQQMILQLFLQGKDLSAVAQTLQQKIGHPVLIVDRHGALKGESKKASALAKRWPHMIEEHPDLLLWNPTTTFTTTYHQHELKTCRLFDHSLVLFAIRSIHQVQGYLVIDLPQDLDAQALLQMATIHIIEKAATASALWFQRETAVIEMEARLRGDFVWSLANGEIDSREQLLIRAKSLQYDVNASYSCLVGIPANLASVYKKQKNRSLPFENWAQEVTSYVTELLTQTAKTLKKKSMITFQSEQFIIFLETNGEQPGKQALDYLKRVNQKLSKYLPELVISWGIGEPHSGDKAFHASYSDARTALDIGNRQKGEGHVTTYAETGIYRILRTLIHHEELRKLTLQTIGKLFEQDEDRGLELLHTLKTYIRNQGNVSQAARALNLHRQSLLYRLKKIESLTGRTLTNPDDLFLIDLSAKLWTAGIADEQRK